MTHGKSSVGRMLRATGAAALFGLGLWLVGLPAGAQLPPEDKGAGIYMRSFEEMDTNKDGVVTREEFLESDAASGETLRLEVRELDVDGDGKISEEEFRARQEKVLSRFRYCNVCDVDANRDGFLTDQEFWNYYTKQKSRTFERADTNGDGSVTKREWTLFRF